MELDPFGFDDEFNIADWSERLSTIYIANDVTGTMSRGNYTYKIYRRGDEKNNGKPLREGRIEGFPRKSKTANHLLLLVLQDAFGILGVN